MSTKENLNNANELGRTVAALMAQPMPRSTGITQAVENLIAALATKAHELLNPPAAKASTPTDEIVLGAGDTATIHGNGAVELVRSGTINYIGPAHASDCSTNNRGVPELLGPCDCKQVPCEHSFPVTMSAPIRLLNQDLTRYLSEAFRQGNIDHVVRVVTAHDGQAEFYIRPMNADGETVQFSAYTTNVNA
jgi:hypothetical protein